MPVTLARASLHAMTVTALSVLPFASALAQGAGPFGVGRPDGQAVMTYGLGGWLLAEQAAFNRAMATALKAAAEQGSLPLLLIGIGAIYGVLHAAGPGHGKAVISAYLFATGETIRRGLLLATSAALLQAVVAIALVASLSLALGATAKTMDAMTLDLERASYVAIAAMGLWLVWRKAQWLWQARGDADGEPGHVHGPSCGHLLALEATIPAEPRRRFTAERAGGAATPSSAVAAVLAGGLRPCTGALLILVFALSQGAFAAGIAATFAMAFGTAITVAGIAALAVGAKGIATRLVGSGGASSRRLLAVVELGAGAAILVLGSVMAVGAT
jgi:nickel/cobalt transporter (NicO) family protein